MELVLYGDVEEEEEEEEELGEKETNDDDDNNDDDSDYDDDITPTLVMCLRKCYISRHGKGKGHARTGHEGPDGK